MNAHVRKLSIVVFTFTRFSHSNSVHMLRNCIRIVNYEIGADKKKTEERT